MNYINYWGNEKPKCPHCGEDFDVWDGDHAMSLSYEDSGQTTFECAGCRKDFVCVTMVQYRFHTAVSEEAADDERWGPQTEPAPSDDAEFGMTP